MNSKGQDRTKSQAEGAHFFRCFLGRGKPPDALIGRYSSACLALELPFDQLTARLVAARADLESAELVRRQREPGNGLTKRALVMLALAEALPEYRNQYLLLRDAKWRAWSALVSAPLRYLYGWGKGTILLWWYGRGF